MQRIMTFVFTLALLLPAPSQGQDTLGGVERLACEALLCLSSGTRPSECSPSLSHYFGIQKRFMPDTIEARLNFLMMCPLGAWPSGMLSLADAISRGAGTCTADELNMVLRHIGWSYQEQIYSHMPEFCRAYYDHEYTDLGNAKPKYVGTPDRAGKWVEADEYDEAKRRYEKYLEDLRDGRILDSGFNGW